MVQTADLLTWAIQPEDAPAHVGRLLASALLDEGVVAAADGAFQVTENTGSDMNILVGSGTLGDLAAIAGEAAGQGVYVTEHQAATQQYAIAASDPGDDRIDLVVARVYDDEADSSGNSYADVEVIEGTPAGSPSTPALPDGAIPLAEILVQASVSAITDSDITDVRGEAKIRNAALPDWQTYTPTFNNFTLSDGTIGDARYIQIGKLVMVKLSVSLGSSSSVSGAIEVSLPVAAADPWAFNTSGIAHFVDAAVANYPGRVLLPTTTHMRLTAINSSGTWAAFGATSSTVPFTWGTGDSFHVRAMYESG